MSTQRSRAGRSSLVATSVIIVLIFIGLVALVEKGPVVPGLPQGASPLNPLSLGTLLLMKNLEQHYRVRVISSLQDLESVSGARCVYVTISPEEFFTESEANYIVNSLKSKCSRPVVLVADESTYSNELLKALNTSLRITGGRIYVEECSGGECRYSPYPPAVLLVGNESISIVLDKASNIIGHGTVRGLVNTSCIIGLTLPGSSGFIEPCSNTSSIQLGSAYESSLSNPVVAAEDQDAVIPVYVIGDGSVFLNQVLGSSNHTEYRVFVSELFSYLCDGSGDCLVLLDNMHYTTVNPVELLSNPARITSGMSMVDAVYVYSLIASIVLHPAFWMPLVFRYIDGYVSTLLGDMLTATIVALILAVVVNRLATSGEVFVSDEALGEQVERDISAFEHVRSRIIEGKERLSRSDFINVYWLANQASIILIGAGLEDPSFIEKASPCLDPGWLSSYREYMVKLYRKATGKSRRLLIVRWHKAVLKAFNDTDKLITEIASKLHIEDYHRLMAGRVE